MLKYFLFSSIILHLSLGAFIVFSSTKAEVRSTTWSTYEVTLLGTSGMGGTGIANAEKTSKGLITSPKPRNKHSALKEKASKQNTGESNQSKRKSPDNISLHAGSTISQTDALQKWTDNGNSMTAERGLTESDPNGIPHGQGGFGHGHKRDGIGKTNTIPVAIHQVRPEYPRRARQRSITGKVVISCIVNIDGSVADPIIIKSSPEGIFDKCACTALKHWKFRPALHQGRPISSRITIPFRFELN